MHSMNRLWAVITLIVSFVSISSKASDESWTAKLRNFVMPSSSIWVITNDRVVTSIDKDLVTDYLFGIYNAVTEIEIAAESGMNVKDKLNSKTNPVVLRDISSYSLKLLLDFLTMVTGKNPTIKRDAKRMSEIIATMSESDKVKLVRAMKVTGAHRAIEPILKKVWGLRAYDALVYTMGYTKDVPESQK